MKPLSNMMIGLALITLGASVDYYKLAILLVVVGILSLGEGIMAHQADDSDNLPPSHSVDKG